MQVTSAKFQQNVGLYQDAAQREPVAIAKNGRTHTVLVSAAFFELVNVTPSGAPGRGPGRRDFTRNRRQRRPAGIHPSRALPSALPDTWCRATCPRFPRFLPLAIKAHQSLGGKKA